MEFLFDFKQKDIVTSGNKQTKIDLLNEILDLILLSSLETDLQQLCKLFSQIL